MIIFSGRKCAVEKEIIRILTRCGAGYISDKKVISDGGDFTVVSEYKKTDLRLKNGIALFLDDTERFDGQEFPAGMTGVCEDTNTKALELFRRSRIPVISCGMSSLNTITLSSINSDTLLASLQRAVTDSRGNSVDPGEFRIRLNNNYSPLAVMASVAVLLLRGITPEEF